MTGIYKLINNTNRLTQEIFFDLVINTYKLIGNSLDKLDLIKQNYCLRENEIFIIDEIDNEIKNIDDL